MPSSPPALKQLEELNRAHVRALKAHMAMSREEREAAYSSLEKSQGSRVFHVEDIVAAHQALKKASISPEAMADTLEEEERACSGEIGDHCLGCPHAVVLPADPSVGIFYPDVEDCMREV